ncbi:nuclear transport factor 2 family protein [Vibrio sp. LaRot3]|uniref:nuclear transport factor 2 family protein n=1 Tax=Vibrio sp. LaRot3 TaxID=2998829 RepID=UPI0022CDC8A9|nr:nuclear transport factor 2 family protein [Vibrio sp. LaRot3]MDA0147280.1 nuclear transport factor 2 family protein [Vibrio sp. LaRot3]
MDVVAVSELYKQLDGEHLHLLEDIYHSDVVFEDAAHRIEGRESLYRYFENLYQNVHSCVFHISETHQSGNKGFIVWVMDLQHPKLNAGRAISVHGVTHLTFADQKVIHHRDYFDLGEMLYEQLPLLGSVVRAIKRRLGQ